MSIEVTLKPRTARSKLSRRDPAPKSSALPPAGNVANTFEKVDHRYSMPRVLHPSILETSATRSNVLVSVIGLATNCFHKLFPQELSQEEAASHHFCKRLDFRRTQPNLTEAREPLRSLG